MKRGITIKLGYADTAIYKCSKCDEPECYCTSPKCKICGSETEFQRAISFVDAPGHEILMATMLSGAAVMDGALLVIAADERCPQPQTREHLAAVDIIGVKKIVIVQNKIDIVTREDSIKNFNEIKKFVKGSVAENAPIIPISAQHGVNIDVLLSMIEKHVPTPNRDFSKPPRMYILRSFDVNKPGTQVEELRGGVLGGSLIQGKFRVGDEVEIRPGLPVREKNKLVMHELFTEILGLHAGGVMVEEALPGGLIGIGTALDPSVTKSDGLVGSMIGKPGALPPVLNDLTLDVNIFNTVIGSQEMEKVEEINKGETLLFNVGTSKTTGIVSYISKDRLEASLSIPICGEMGDRVAISRRISGRWRLIGVGVLRG